MRFRDEDIVSVPVNFAEKELRDRLKAVGGKWHPEEKVWHVRFGLIRGTDLEGESWWMAAKGSWGRNHPN